MSYQLIASDLDGTLFGEDLQASGSNVASIQKALEKGVNVVLSTGRPPLSTMMVAHSLGITGSDQYLICFNGGAIARAKDGEILESVFLEEEVAKIILENAYQYDTSVISYIDGLAHSRKSTDDIVDYGSRVKRPVTIDPEFDKKMTAHYHKIVIVDKPEVLLQIQSQVLPLVGDKIDYIYSTPTLLEFLPKGVSKGNALLKLAEKLSLRQEELIAVGDYYNDVSMIEAAGLGVTIKGAPADIQAVAQYVTEKSAEEGAISEVIERFLFGAE